MDRERGQRLRQIREHFAESQESFAARFHLTAAAISRYESGRFPPEEILIHLANMGFAICWLLHGDGDMFCPIKCQHKEP